MADDKKPWEKAAVENNGKPWEIASQGGDPIKKKVPTDLQGTGALITAPKKPQTKLDQLLSQDKSFVYTPGSEEDLASESNLEDQTEGLLKERQKNAPKSFITLPVKKRNPNDPLSVEEIDSNLKKLTADSHKLSKKLELTESESYGFANPLARLTKVPPKAVPSDLMGVEFWDNEYAASNAPRVDELTGKTVKQGFENYAYSREDGLLFDKVTAAPVVLKKVMDDYVNFIQKTQPEKYKFLSLMDRGELTPQEVTQAESNKKLASYLKPYVDKDRAAQAMAKGSSVPVNQMNQVERYNLLMEALNHQSIILNQDYADMQAAGVADANEKYSRGRKALEDLSSQILKSFPDMAKEVEAVKKVQQAKINKQNAADQFYDNYLRQGGFWNDPDMGLRMYMAQPVASSLQDFAAGWATLPRDLGLESASPALAEIVKIGDAIGSEENVPQLSTAMQESLVPQVVKGVSDMSLLLLGTKGLGSVMAAGYKPAMFANSFAMTHDNYYQEAKEAGLSDRDASEHAARSAALTSALEFISPNQAIVNGFRTSITGNVIKSLSEGVTLKEAFNTGAKDFLKQVGAENAQEITQLLGDKASNYFTNQMLGKSQLDTEIRADDIMNTMMVTTAVTGLVTAPGIRNKSSLQRDFMYTAATNPALAETAINNAVETNQIDKTQATTLRKKLTDYKSVIDGLPVKLPNAQKAKLADLVYQKKLLTEQQTESYVDPVFKNTKAAEQKAAEEEIDNEIKTTINDTQEQQGLPGVIEGGETAIETGSIQKEGQETITASGILQAQEPTVDEPAEQEDLDAYVQRMLEEHKAEDEVAAPKETAFAEKFYTKKWMDKFGQAKPIAEQPVLTEQQIEETPYGDQETADAFEGRVQDEVNESEAVIEAIEREAEDVGSSQDRARAAELYGRVTDVIGQKVADLRTRKGYSVENKEGKLTVLNTEGQPVKSEKVRQAVLRNYKNTLKVLNDSGILRVVDQTGAEVTKPEFTDNLIAKYKATFPFDQGRTSIEVAETGDPVELSENPMELAAIGTPGAAVKFKQLTGIEMEEYQESVAGKEKKLLTDTLLEGLDAIDAFLKDPSGGGLTALPIPTQLLRPVVKAIKLAVKAGRPIEQAIREGRKLLDELLAGKSPEEIQTANRVFDAMASDLGGVQKKIQTAKKKGTEQGYKFGLAEGKLAGEIRGMAEGKKLGAKEQREKDRETKRKLQPYKDAMASRKSIKRKIRVKQKGAKSVFANDRNTLKEFIQLDPMSVSNVEDYNDIANRIKESISNPLVRADGSITRGGRTISNQEINQYIEDQSKFIEATRIPEQDPELEQLLQNTDVSAIPEDALAKKKKALEDLVAGKLSDVKSVFDTIELTPLEKKIWNGLQKVDVTKLSIPQLATFNNVMDNIIVNDSLAGAGIISSLSEAQSRAPKIAEVLSKFGTGKIGDEGSVGKLGKLTRMVRRSAYPLPTTMQRLAIMNEQASDLQNLLGMTELFSGNSDIDLKADAIQKGRNDIVDAMPRDIRSTIDEVKQRYKRGAYAFMIINQGGSVEDINNEFSRRKSIIKDQIKVLTQATDANYQEQGKILQEIYDELGAEKANNYTELTPDKYTKQLVDYFIEQGGAVRDDLFEHSTLYNDVAPVPNNNHTSTSYVNYGEQLNSETIGEIGESQFNKDQVFEGGSRTTMALQKNHKLPRNKSGNVTKLLNLDFDNVQSRKIREALYEIKTQDARILFNQLMEMPEVEKALGGKSNKDALIRGMKSTIEAQMRSAPDAPVIKEINSYINTLSARGVRIALQGLLQPAKQVPSVFIGYAIRNPKMIGEIFNFRKTDNNLYKYGTILTRKGMQAGYQRQQPVSDISKAEVRKFVSRMIKASGIPKLKEEVLDRISDIMMKPLINSDNWIAKQAWKGYYKQYRVYNQLESNFDWAVEEKNPDPQASAFAEQMIDVTQNPSDYSKMGPALRDAQGSILKNLYVPLSSFAITQRGRIGADIQKIRKAPTNMEGYQGLAATMSEAMAFNAVKIYLLSIVGGVAYKGLLEVLGYSDDEEKDENKVPELLAKSLADFTLSGFGSVADYYGKKRINDLYSVMTGDEKPVIPVYTPPPGQTDLGALGLYGTVPQSMMEGYDDFYKWWTGKTPAIIEKGGLKHTDDIGQLNQKQRNAMFVFGMYELMKVSGLSEQTVNSAMAKAKRLVDKEIRKEQGSETLLPIGKVGDLYRKSDSGGGRSRVKRERKERTRRNRR